MSGFKTPPQSDFHSYASLVSQQGGHLSKLAQWCDSQCANTDGLDGLLVLPLLAIVPEVSRFFGDKCAQSRRGMDLIGDKIHSTSDAYTGTDQATAATISSLYPHSFSHFPDISAIPGGSDLGNFTDEGVNLKEPADADETTSKSIHHQLELVRGELGGAEKVFKFLTGQSLVDLLVTPLVGEYGRLRYLEDAYDQLAEGVYTVAGTLRKGSWRLGSEWSGEAATAYDEYLFRWTMGIGGIGDAAKLAAKVYHDGYDAIVALVFTALREINQLIKEELKDLEERAAKMAAGDAAIEAVGLGPEDPLADVGAGIWSAYQMYKIYQDVKKVISVINAIEKTFELIKKAVETIRTDVQKVIAFMQSPMTLPTVGSLINDVEQRGFEFEKNGGWSPTVGAARIGMLPAA
jgi:uncharacterized protein YukE